MVMTSTRDTNHGTGLNGAVAAVLRGERAASQFTLKQLAERAAIPLVSTQRLLAAERAITMDTLAALCAALGVAPDEVMARAMKRLG